MAVNPPHSEVLEIIDLVETGDAKHIRLSFITNGTVVRGLGLEINLYTLKMLK